MSISLTPVPHARPTSKPPSPVRPALKLAVRLNPDGSPLVLPPGHRDDGRDKHAHGGARRLIPLIHPPRPLLAPRADVRGYHSVCNSTLNVRDFRRRRRRSVPAMPATSRWGARGTRGHRAGRCLQKLPRLEQSAEGLLSVERGRRRQRAGGNASGGNASDACVQAGSLDAAEAAPQPRRGLATK